MICDTYTIWICPHCEYWAADHEHEDLYNSVHLSMHAGCDQPFAPLTGIVCKPVDGAVPDPGDVYEQPTDPVFVTQPQQVNWNTTTFVPPAFNPNTQFVTPPAPEFNVDNINFTIDNMPEDDD